VRIMSSFYFVVVLVVLVVLVLGTVFSIFLYFPNFFFCGYGPMGANLLLFLPTFVY
jgi:hypothetical protein